MSGSDNPLVVGEEVKIKPTERTICAGIANIQAEVVAILDEVVAIRVGDEKSGISGDYVALHPLL